MDETTNNEEKKEEVEDFSVKSKGEKTEEKFEDGDKLENSEPVEELRNIETVKEEPKVEEKPVETPVIDAPNINEEPEIPEEEIHPEIKPEVPKQEPKPMNKEAKSGSFMPMVFVMIISLVIAFAWDKVDFIRNAVHAVLDPSAGVLLAWNLTAGMLIIVVLINIITTVIQKYATDQDALRELKKEQKLLQEEMKKYKDRPEKVAELSKKQFEFIPKTFKLTSRAIMFTGIPFILFFRWFTDVFTAMEVATGAPVRFLGFLSWFWFYLIFTMIASTILRKMLKVV